MLFISAASQSHLEWLLAYRNSRDREDGAVTPVPVHVTSHSTITTNSESYQSLRQLLAKGTDEQQSASGFLRSIVRSIMQQGRDGDPDQGYPPTSTANTPKPNAEVELQNMPELSPFSPGHAHAPIKIEPDSEIDDRSSVMTDMEETNSAMTIYSLPSPQGDDDPPRNEGPPPLELPGDGVPCNPPYLTGALLAAALYQNNSGGTKRKAPDEEGGLLVRQQLRSMIDKRRYPGPLDSGATQLGEVRVVLAETNSGPPDMVKDSHNVSTISPQTTTQSQSVELASSYSQLKDACVQCELLKSTSPVTNAWHSSEGSSTRTEALVQEGDCGSSSSSTAVVNPRCQHCGIQFDDDVLYSIHMGCHSHRDPFICNVCGRHCGNKYAFYTHIMRGHHN